MKLTKDLLNCAKLAVYIFIGVFLVGLIIGYLQSRGQWGEVLLWGARLSLIASAIGLGIVGMSFLKPDTMRPLEYQKQWEEYYSVLNLTYVILFVSLFLGLISFAADYLIRTAF